MEINNRLASFFDKRLLCMMLQFYTVSFIYNNDNTGEKMEQDAAAVVSSDEEEFVLDAASIPISQLQRKIVTICSQIFRTLGPGFRELAYQKALEYELAQEGLAYMDQQPILIYYKGRGVGMGYSDIIVENRLVIELKASKSAITPGNLNQCRGYMRALHIAHGLVINFPQYKARTAEIDVYDCFLGTTYPTIPLDPTVRDHADNGLYGPGPRAPPPDIQEYCTCFVCIYAIF